MKIIAVVMDDEARSRVGLRRRAGEAGAVSRARTAVLLIALALASCARALELEFVVDDEVLIHALCQRGALMSAAAEDARAAVAVQNRMWGEKAPYDVLSGRWTPSVLRPRGAAADPPLRRLVDAVRAWPEFAAVRRRAGVRRDFCKRQWAEDRERAERFVRDLTGLSFDRTYRVYVLSPAMAGGQNLGGGAIRWGGREDWPHYTTVYLWHEVLHDDLPKNGVGHALIQLVTDRELRRHLTGVAGDDGYSGHPELRAITEKLLPAWELYKKRRERRVLELCAELEKASR